MTLLYMRYKGMISLRGREDSPLLRPFVKQDNMKYDIKDIKWNRQYHWVPSFKGIAGDIKINATILAPINERGFVYSFAVENPTDKEVSIELGLEGTWSRAIHEINESKEIEAKRIFYKSNWNKGSYCFDLKDAFTILSFAPMPEEGMTSVANYNNKEIDYYFSKEVNIAPGEEKRVNYYFGIGYEEVAAITSAKEMYRRGFEYEFKATYEWLKKRMKRAEDENIERILNENLFFNFFFATGKTLDTEDLVLVTSRSPRYYVSAAYWDRDSLLWSFPSILIADSQYAKKMLNYVFKTQIKNIGIHSRYIDGTVLEPGFELDELCAPVIALYNYVVHTGDYDIINIPEYKKGIESILEILDEHRHESIELYDTFLQPTDDMIVYPYLTYNNILVWRILKNLGEINEKLGNLDKKEELFKRADKVKTAINENCIVEHKGKKIFAWSVDLQGNFNIYDEPPGSLLLSAYMGFCSYEDEVYVDTVKNIKDPSYAYSFANCNIAEIGCEHAPHPWILSLCNSLLCGEKEHAREILMKTNMDNGIACESVNEHTGQCETGAAFATCAGFLAYALYEGFGLNSGKK
ncbi:metal-independent alpha-mannosidase [Alkaliphilus serpentinus]|uniref:Metal-independent alpha-mannosidase n=2 Tax=Alkaliphilus serpentinus TaxID=1482731 RepID=A0A833HLP7_9FIRM|nr:metal-independent alpha-mannosidase [Alkaliphilus serpentinus]